MKELVKEVKQTLLNWGFDINKDYWDLFVDVSEIKWGSSQPVAIHFNRAKYSATLAFKNRLREKGGPVLQLVYGKDLQNALKKEFSSSFFFFEGEKFVERETKNFTPSLPADHKEFLSISCKDDQIYFKTFLKRSSIFDKIFAQFIDKDLFGWFNKENDSKIIMHYSQWLDIKELKKFSSAAYIIYCLVDDKQKLFYIGHALNLGKRVRENRNEIPNWNRFMYAELHPNFRQYMNELEYFAINMFARFFNNCGNIKYKSIDGYTQVNKDYIKKYKSKKQND